MSVTMETILAKLKARRHAVESSVRLHHWSGHYRGAATHNAKLTDAQVISIRERHRAGSTTRELAAEHGVHHTAIWYAVTKRPMLLKCGRVQWRFYTWNHVPENIQKTVAGNGSVPAQCSEVAYKLGVPKL